MWRFGLIWGRCKRAWSKDWSTLCQIRSTGSWFTSRTPVSRESKNPVLFFFSRLIREELAAARKELRDSGIRLITTSKAYFVNPNMKAAQNNRESAIKVNIPSYKWSYQRKITGIISLVHPFKANILIPWYLKKSFWGSNNRYFPDYRTLLRKCPPASVTARGVKLNVIL